MSDARKRLGMVIVDLQNDFLSNDGAYARGKTLSAQAQGLPGLILPVVHAVKALNGMVIASQFTLLPNALGEPMISPHLKEKRPFLRKGDFAPGSVGQSTVDLLLPFVDVQIQKVAYSAFFNTQLDWVLKKSQIDTLIVCGIVTNGGVASTVRDAHVRDYDVIVLSDGCAAFSADAHQAALADMRSVGEVKTIAETLTTIARWNTGSETRAN